MKINYLRISITDFCNLNCFYCRPSQKIKYFSFNEILRFEEIVKFVNYVSNWGIDKVRITGGEPLLKKNILELIEMLAKIKKIKDLAITTNGTLLEKYATSLKKSGLKRINISLDTLSPSKFIKITGHDKFEEVMAGLKESLKCGFNQIKINVVVIPNFNDDEILDFIKFSLENNLCIRFIEHMGIQTKNNVSFLSNSLIKEKITNFFGPLENVSLSKQENGPAQYFKIKGHSSLIGLISPRSEKNFCNNCNRLRLTINGQIRPCLLSDFAIDIKKSLKKDDEIEIKHLFNKAISLKSPYLKKNFNKKHMFQIGG
ncbi:MAG: GTP 3',8-cyclase MoaA [bacterium]